MYEDVNSLKYYCFKSWNMDWISWKVMQWESSCFIWFL